jgi:CRP-like cAMP-binding protein
MPRDNLKSSPLLADIFPDWLIERKDFQLAFPRFSKSITGQEVTRAAFQKSPELRTNEDLHIMCQWMRQFPLLGKLGENQLKSLCRRIACITYPKGEYIFKQGDLPDAFFLTFSGRLDVIVDGEKVSVLNQGDGFGELALENENTRAATIKTATTCLLIVVRAHDYKENIKSFQSAKTVAMIKWFAKLVPITSDWSTSRLHKIATVVNMKMFSPGDIVVQQGQPAAEMYFIRNGTAIMQKEIVQEVGNRWPTDSKSWDKISHRFAMPVPLAHITEGDFFGEDNLIGKDERQYTVVCTSPMEVVVLNRTDAEELFCGKTLYKINHRNRTLFKTVEDIKTTHDKARAAMKEFVDLKLTAMGPSYYNRLLTTAPDASTPTTMKKHTRAMLEQEQMDKMDIYWQEKLNGSRSKETKGEQTPKDACRRLRKASLQHNRRMSKSQSIEEIQDPHHHHHRDPNSPETNGRRLSAHHGASALAGSKSLEKLNHAPPKMTSFHEVVREAHERKRQSAHKIKSEIKLRPIGMLQRGSTRKNLGRTMGETKSLGKTDLKDMARIVIHQHESHVSKVGFEFEHKLRKVSSNVF